LALIIHFDGREEPIEPKDGISFMLAELKPIVGEGAEPGEDMIELYPLPDGRLMVLNEEGKLIGLPRNGKATVLCNFPSPKERRQMADNHTATPGEPVIMVGFDDNQPDYIAGTVLVCRNDEVR
jgi:hypothetical protein